MRLKTSSNRREKIMTQNNPLHVAYEDNKPNNRKPRPDAKARKQEIQASMERMWLQDPQQFDPRRNCMERQRIDLTFNAIKTAAALAGKSAADLGCGSGVLSFMMRDAGAHVDAVDAAGNALAMLKDGNTQNITVIQDCLPNTALNDNAYDAVICTEVIAYLRQDEYRLLMAELARLVKADGAVICSTGLDINTENPLDRFASLAETEFTIEKWIVNYHLLLIKLCRFFEAPSKYVKAYHDTEVRQKEIRERNGFGRFWFRINSTPAATLFWRLVGFAFNPIAKFLKQNKITMQALESISRFFWSDAGISHALFVGKRRPLTYDVKPSALPRELKHKRQVWE